MRTVHIPVIRIREKGSRGKGRLIGTDSHDLLQLTHGDIHYFNMRTGEGTGYKGLYEFTGNHDEYFGKVVEFVTLPEYLQMLKEELNDSLKEEAELINSLMLYLDKKEAEAKERRGNIRII